MAEFKILSNAYQMMWLNCQKTVAELSVNLLKPTLYVASYGTVLHRLIRFDGLKYVIAYVAWPRIVRT